MEQFLNAVSSCKGARAIIDTDVKDTLVRHYLPLRNALKLPKRDDRTTYMGETAKDLATNINTNITEHFFSRHRKYVKWYYDLTWDEARDLEEYMFKDAEETGGGGFDRLPQKPNLKIALDQKN